VARLNGLADRIAQRAEIARLEQLAKLYQAQNPEVVKDDHLVGFDAWFEWYQEQR
jgi:hypothetical protein